MKNTALIIALLFLSLPLIAGDMADIINLGFSQNEEYFMFGEYGRSSQGYYTNAFIINVKQNTFVPSGILQYTDQRPSILNQDGRSALFILLENNRQIIQNYKIDHLNTGRPLYFAINGNTENIHFRDFLQNISYTVQLTQTQKVNNNVISSKFHITITQLMKDGTKKTNRVGTANLYRKNVAMYKIIQIVLSPKEKSIIFIIEKHQKEKNARSIRYMIESLSLDFP